MSSDEVAAFLAEEHTAIFCTLLADGRIHAVPMWYLPDGSTLIFSAKSKSQKVVNLRRDGRATVLVESGRVYDQLRGVEMNGHTEVIDAPQLVFDYATALSQRYGSGTNQALTVEQKARNRSILRFVPDRVASWDHRKVAGSA
jgi:PPOX class probable F420-dependent enzyme